MIFWFVRKHGRLNMEVLAARKEIGVSLVVFPAEEHPVIQEPGTEADGANKRTASC